MKLRTLFEKQVFVRLSEDHATFICTTKWQLLSIVRRIVVGQVGPAQRSRTELDSPNGRVREANSRV